MNDRPGESGGIDLDVWDTPVILGLGELIISVNA